MIPLCQAADPQDESSGKREPKKLISLAESITKTTNSFQDPTVEEIRRQYWQKTLADIRNMSFGFTTGTVRSGTSGSTLGQQWKWGFEESAVAPGPTNETTTTDTDRETSATDTTTTLEPALKGSNNFTFFSGKPRRRFDGFMSWDRMLQEWAEDVQEYMDQVERETNGADYAFGNFGRGLRTESKDTSDAADNVSTTSLEEVSTETFDSSFSLLENNADEDVIAESVVVSSSKGSTKKATLPIPAPAQPGEAVLSHTDISDLSKRIEIVTTASLPWRTGTAVNPLLRAAYLTHGRAAAGGSVTLMLPWLERRADQEKVYGTDQTFESPSEQEAYIRDWLRNAANMPEAATDLRIRWYTAWQNPAENSIYSMGDITALIPPDEVDICILEEPEHLNWYRAPGESWTKRFKHVVGILHTSKFCVLLPSFLREKSPNN